MFDAYLNVLIKGALSNVKKIRDDYTWRLKKVVKIFDSLTERQLLSAGNNNGDDDEDSDDEGKKETSKRRKVKPIETWVPPEILIEIFVYIPFKDIPKLALVSKDFRAVIDMDAFWKKKIKTEFPGYDFPLFFGGPKVVTKKSVKTFFTDVASNANFDDKFFLRGNELILKKLIDKWAYPSSGLRWILEKYCSTNKNVELKILFLIDFYNAKLLKWNVDFNLRGMFDILIKYKSKYNKKKFIKSVFISLNSEGWISRKIINKDANSLDIERAKGDFMFRVIKDIMKDKIYSDKEYVVILDQVKFLKELVEIYPLIYIMLEEKFKTNNTIVEKLLSINGLLINWIPLSLQKNKRVVLFAIKNSNGRAFGGVVEYFNWEDQQFLFLEAIKQDPKKFSMEESYDYLHTWENSLIALKLDRKNYNAVDDNLKLDENFILEAVKQDGLLLEELDEDARRDPVIVNAAIAQNSEAKKYSLIKNPKPRQWIPWD